MSNTFEYPLTAIHIDGETIDLPDIDAALHFIARHGRWHERHISIARSWLGNMLVCERETHPWIVRDHFGRMVPATAIPVPARRYGPYWARSKKIVAQAIALGLPVPGTGCSKAGYKQNAPAKKNSGRGHRNRNRARAIYDAAEYGVKNNVGNRVIPWEGSD